ncbi:MAG: hypothetical protein ACFFB2_10045 [Promethearchaeota archaeon]
MSSFSLPEVKDFFDNRLIISWNITQPPHLPPLKNLIIQISSSPQLTFDPLQDPRLEITELDGNDLIINWVIQRPEARTEVTISIQSKTLFEEYTLIICP